MIPLPPLDGYRLIKILSPKAGFRLEKNMHYIAIGFLLLVVVGPLSGVLGSYISGVSEWLLRIFSLPLKEIFY